MKSIFKGMFGLILAASLAFSACKKDNGCGVELRLNVSETQLAEDITLIDAYLTDHEIDAIMDETGLRYVVEETGTGGTADLCSVVSVTYTGRLLETGEVFETIENPVVFSLNHLITGWQIGIPKIKEGGRITLYVPSVYAYGNAAVGDIPPNSNLIFTINLIGVR